MDDYNVIPVESDEEISVKGMGAGTPDDMPVAPEDIEKVVREVQANG